MDYKSCRVAELALLHQIEAEATTLIPADLAQSPLQALLTKQVLASIAFQRRPAVQPVTTEEADEVILASVKRSAAKDRMWSTLQYAEWINQTASSSRWDCVRHGRSLMQTVRIALDYARIDRGDFRYDAGGIGGPVRFFFETHSPIPAFISEAYRRTHDETQAPFLVVLDKVEKIIGKKTRLDYATCTAITKELEALPLAEYWKLKAEGGRWDSRRPLELLQDRHAVATFNNTNAAVSTRETIIRDALAGSDPLVWIDELPLGRTDDGGLTLTGLATVEAVLEYRIEHGIDSDFAFGVAFEDLARTPALMKEALGLTGESVIEKLRGIGSRATAPAVEGVRLD